jgi:hypothetical protein
VRRGDSLADEDLHAGGDIGRLEDPTHGAFQEIHHVSAKRLRRSIRRRPNDDGHFEEPGRVVVIDSQQLREHLCVLVPRGEAHGAPRT